jgi:hypothetical protein
VAAVADGFLGRWSQRKQAVRAGQTLEEPQAIARVNRVPVQVPAPGVVSAPLAAEPALAEAPALPTLADVEALTPSSDFAPFVARDVTPDVRNAAMKKLFTDPHYNVMDGLDIYIDDYSKPDPLPESMLRQMVSAKFLNLFEEETPEPDQTVAQSVPSLAAADSAPLILKPPVNPGQEPDQDHDHTDLRLQPNHAAGRHSPGRSTE